MLLKAENGHSNFYFLFLSHTFVYLEFQLMTQLLGMEGESRHLNIQQKPKPSGNILLMLQSKRWLMVLILCVLWSNKKSIIKIRNGKYAKHGIRNWNSSTGSVIEVFKYAKYTEEIVIECRTQLQYASMEGRCILLKI